MSRLVPHFLTAFIVSIAVAFSAVAATTPGDNTQKFITSHCADCHDADTHKGGLDLTALKLDLNDSQTFTIWVKVHDRVEKGEMPPKKETPPPREDLDLFVNALTALLTDADRARIAQEGRSTRRRLNRYEYEDTLRDLLSLPNLQVKEFLPEDGESHLFNKVGDALDVSHVNMARYLSAADYALRQAMAPQIAKPETKTVRYYAREAQNGLTGQFNVGGPVVRRTFPVLGTEGQPDVFAGKAPLTVGAADPKKREKEAVGIVVSTYEPTEIRFAKFKAPVAGQYRIRMSAYSIWVGNSTPGKPWIPDFGKISVGRRDEPVTLYSDTPPRLLRKLGSFDVQPDAKVNEMIVWLAAGETIRPDAARFFRSRPPEHRNPLAEKDGMPGVAFHWMEVEGPLIAQWPAPGHRLLFGELPLTKREGSNQIDVVSSNPEHDAAALLHTFMSRAYRRPVAEVDETRFMTVIQHALKDGQGFADAMIAGYTAVLCSPEFLYIDEKPGRLDDRALAGRLSYFLWNTSPDDELRRLAAEGKLHDPKVLNEQTERLLNDPKSRRFINDFLDYWLDLRKIAATAPDATLYPDYQLDDLLVESMIEETQLYFAELVKKNLGIKNIVSSDFAMINERLANHYGIPGVKGVALRRVALPPDSLRGGLMTQASILKVTANGTTTSPVLRGVWIMERILGQRPPPPPPSVPAVEPDTRGATTIREQLAKHRSQQTCAACHRKIDPAGFALESFDTMGAFRDRYRSLGSGDKVPGAGHNGISFTFSLGPKVDPTGEMPDGGKFQDVRELKKLLLNEPEQLARNLVQQLTIYATGAPIQFSDRPAVARILANSKADGYGVRTLIHEIVQSELFGNK